MPHRWHARASEVQYSVRIGDRRTWRAKHRICDGSDQFLVTRAPSLGLYFCWDRRRNVTRRPCFRSDARRARKPGSSIGAGQAVCLGIRTVAASRRRPRRRRIRVRQSRPCAAAVLRRRRVIARWLRLWAKPTTASNFQLIGESLGQRSTFRVSSGPAPYLTASTMEGPGRHMPRS